MDMMEFAESIKSQARLHGVEGVNLEAAVGLVLTETVNQQVEGRDRKYEIFHKVFVLVTVMSAMGMKAEILDEPAFRNIIKKIEAGIHGRMKEKVQ